ncbi:MAG TPA: heavy metal-binding domain-containing protein [Lacipirellulaceae bacterium]|nr:heavy metal-binding domain-containing protein [Lacipirellulaceae bacterium]
MGIIFGAFVLLMLLGLGFFVGGTIERRHFRQLDEREAGHRDFLVTQLKSFPGAVAGPAPPVMICGEAVISSDYLKSFLGNIRKIFGGEMRSYRSLMVRARREALLRIIEEARSQGYNAVCNVRYESSDIGGGATRRNRAVMSTILATATAYHYRAAQGPA